uniref:zeta toxin family protein n=1 Tax=Prevotella sp. TaxID=59823 RepID=UPI003FED5D22
MAKHLYIIAGCNGAGKTTASMTILPKSLLVKEFVNADEIAKGLSPFNPEGVAIEAGRLMLERIKYLINKEESFSIETTLATRSYINLVMDAHKRGYIVNIIYFWLESPELAANRVAERVSKGGHDIPRDVIFRRYSKGINNLFNLFMDKVDVWAIYDNSQYKRERIAFGGKGIKQVVNNMEKFNKIKDYVK